MSCHFLLTSTVFEDTCVTFQMVFLTVGEVSLFSGCSQGYLSIFGFHNLTMMYLGVDFFRFIRIEIHLDYFSLFIVVKYCVE